MIITRSTRKLTPAERKAAWSCKYHLGEHDARSSCGHVKPHARTLPAGTRRRGA